MESESSLPHSQTPAACPYPEPDQSSPCLPIPPLEESHVPFTLFALRQISPSPEPSELFRNIVCFYGEELLAHRLIPNLSTTRCQLSATACSVYCSNPPRGTNEVFIKWTSAINIQLCLLQFVTKLNPQLLMSSNCLSKLRIAPLGKNWEFCEPFLKKG